MSDFNDKATVSGTVVSIENGADEVGAKSCVVTVSPTLSGVSSVTETQTGRNLIKPDKYQASATQLMLGQTNNTDFETFLKTGTYTISYSITGEPCYIYRREQNDASNTNLGKATSKTFTINEDGNFRFWLYGDGAVYANVSDVQIEVGSTAHAYEPYTTPTQYTASLGRTIYGGTADIVNGEGQETYKKVVLNGTQPNASFGVTVLTGFTQVSYIPYISEGVANGIFVSDTFEQVAKIADVSGAGKMWNSIVPRLFFSLPDTVTTQAQVNAYFADNPAIIVYPIATPTDFTFTGQEVPTRLGYNAFWSDEGDTELTYYKSGYGYTSVTVNRTGKNLINDTSFISGLPSTTIGASIDTITASTRYAYLNLPTGGATITISSRSDDTDLFNSILIYGYKNGALYQYTNASPGTSKTVDFSACDYIRLAIGARTAQYQVPLDLTGYGYLQAEVGNYASNYEPYSGVSKTAKLHKVIYGGEVDVIQGTAKPKNLLNNTLASTTVNGTTFTVNNGIITVSGTPSAQTRVYIKQGEAYTVGSASYFSSGTMPTGTRVFSKKVSGGVASYPTLSPTSSMNTVGDVFSDIFLEVNTNFDGTEFSLYPMIELGSSASDYVPHFEPFTFPPISMETVEGTNVLYADEGDSTITYRRSAD